jgi:hypothetical protein
VSPAAQILRDSAKCTGVTITLPDTITFYGTRGKLVAHIRMVQELAASGSYTITYSPAEDQFLIKPWPYGLVIEVTYNVQGTESEIKSGIDKYKAYIGSMTSPMMLVSRKWRRWRQRRHRRGPASASRRQRIVTSPEVVVRKPAS